jgi:hypothetical protein
VFKEEDLERIKRSIANGTLEVEFNDRRVRYRSIDEMIKIKKMIEKELYSNDTGGVIGKGSIQIIGTKGL